MKIRLTLWGCKKKYIFVYFKLIVVSLSTFTAYQTKAPYSTTINDQQQPHQHYWLYGKNNFSALKFNFSFLQIRLITRQILGLQNAPEIFLPVFCLFFYHLYHYLSLPLASSPFRSFHPEWWLTQRGRSIISPRVLCASLDAQLVMFPFLLFPFLPKVIIWGQLI